MKTHLKYIVVVLLFLLMTGCKKFVEIDPPNNQLITKTVFRDDATAISALTAIYSQMTLVNSFPYNIAMTTGFQSDELKNYATSRDLVQLYVNGLNSIDGVSPDFWQSAYNLIYQSNAVIEGCNQSGTLNEGIKKRLIAEALFIRSFWYFYLVNLYGDVPLILTTDYKQNEISSRIPVSEIYQQLINDLIQVEAELGDQYVAANSAGTSTERVRPNKSTVNALLARVYLYAGKYPEANATASKVIGNTTYQLSSVTGVFLKDSPEAIWQLMMPTPASFRNTLEGANFILVAKPADGTGNNATISDDLYQAFEQTDHRKANWIGVYTDESVQPSVSYRFPYKYKQDGSSGAVTECSIVFRLAELYLIRAEARAELGDLEGARNDLNKIRNRASLGNTTAVTKEALLSAILRERRVELFCEYGHRWFDLKRTGEVNGVMSVTAPQKGGFWSPYKALWPIPTKDILNNTKLKQNQGYN